MKKKSGNLSPGRFAGRIISFFAVTILAIAATLVGVIWVLEKGPSPTVTATFCRSVRETSALRWMPGIFLSEEETAQYKVVSTAAEEITAVNTSLIHVAESAGDASDNNALELIDIVSGNIRGKLMIVQDPSRVILGISGEFGAKHAGLQLTEMVEKYNGIAGTNAGGFNDEGGRGNGGTPQGLVIYEGELVYGQQSRTYSVVGFDKDHILQVGNMTGPEAIERGIEYAVSFVSYDGVASALIVNGEVQTKNLSGGVNPRTAIGQRADGAVLMLVLDGRSITTLGATMSDVVNVMLEYGAVNAANLDGGSSSTMVYNGEIINNCASVTGPRSIPTAFIVLGGAE